MHRATPVYTDITKSGHAENAMSTDDFCENISLKEITVFNSGDVDFWFSDGDILGGTRLWSERQSTQGLSMRRSAANMPSSPIFGGRCWLLQESFPGRVLSIKSGRFWEGWP
jgi:hypothetical protein